MVLGLGLRFVAEAAFLIAVAVAAGVLSLSTPAIVVVMGGAWMLVALVEFGVSRRSAARASRLVAEPPAVVGVAEPEPFAAVPPEPLPEPVPPVLVAETHPPEHAEAAPEGAPPPLPEPIAPAVEPLVEPREEPEPERPPLVAVPSPPEPEPEPEPQAEPEPAAAEVVPIAARSAEPREWNLWELERAVRDRAGADVERDEERAYLLMYLRDFAGPDGTLPANFDGLVRDSFGDLLGSGAR